MQSSVQDVHSQGFHHQNIAGKQKFTAHFPNPRRERASGCPGAGHLLCREHVPGAELSPLASLLPGTSLLCSGTVEL